MKIYKKEECKYVNGYITHGDDIVAIDNEVVDLFNKLDTDIQRKVWSLKNEVKPIHVDEFTRISEHSAELPMLIAKTPILDAKVEEALNLVDELDKMEIADEVNSYCKMLNEVFHFVNADYVIDNEMQGHQHRFDLPTIGDPLGYNADMLQAMIVNMMMMTMEDLEDDEQVESEGD